MYYIQNKLTNTTNLYETLETMLIGLNIILSDLYDETKMLINIEQINDTFVYKIGENMMVSNKIPARLSYLQFVLLHKNVLSQHNINNITPEVLLDIFTSKYCFSNPYNILLNIFNVNEELIYQTFILFLNKTITNNHETNPLNLDNVFNNFFINNSTIDHQKYNRLFTYYLSAKKIYPFMIRYNPYISLYS